MTTTPHCDRFLRDVKPERLAHDQLQALADESGGDVDKPLRAAASNMWDRLKAGVSSEAMLAATGPSLRAARIMFDLALANRLIRKEPWAAGCYHYLSNTTDPTAFVNLAHQIADAWKATQPAQPKPTRLTPEDRKKVHHLLHALAVSHADVRLPLHLAVEAMRKLGEHVPFLWSHFLVTSDPSAAQVVWIVARGACLLPTQPPADRPRFRLFDPADLITALDDTVTLWRHGRLVEDLVTTKDSEPTKHADPEPPMTEQPPQPSIYEQVAALVKQYDSIDLDLAKELRPLRLNSNAASRLRRLRTANRRNYGSRITDLRLANLDVPWDPARVFADTDEAKANMEAAIAAMADPWYQPFSRKDFVLRGPVEQTDARKALMGIAGPLLNVADTDINGINLRSVIDFDNFVHDVRLRVRAAKSLWRTHSGA